jgi:uncharacterized LabA/DUF88 family protein
MTIQSTHFSISCFIKRLWALGLKPEISAAESVRIRVAPRPKLSVFIDIENVSNDVVIRSVFECLAPHWNSICRRAYGSGLATHRQLFRDLGINPIEVFHNTSGKNAADIALVIDVMTELNNGRSEAFCIVTGDGDFTRLALTIREWGLPVLVFGPQSTPESLRSASTEFHLLSSGSMQNSLSFAYKSNATPMLPAAKITTDRKDQSELIRLVHELASDSGKTTLRAINGAGCSRDAGFCSKQYGGPRLSKLLIGMDLFGLSPVRNSKGVVQDYEVRPKTAGITPARAPNRERLEDLHPAHYAEAAMIPPSGLHVESGLFSFGCDDKLS